MGNLVEAQGQDRVREAHEVAAGFVTDWGSPFYGKAHTVTGDVWWYISAGGERIALRPAHVAARDC